MKVVLDTYIYLSGLIFPKTNPWKILVLARNRKITVFCSRFILEEIKKILVIKFNYPEAIAQKFIDEILKFTKVISPTARISVIKTKDDDNRILECALSAKADFLISGDKKHILPLKTIKNIKIISAKEFLSFCDTQES